MTFVPAPGYQPTYNPTLPYSRRIPGGLNVGMSIYIQGMANENMRRFQVNFAMGPEPEADIAFHFNPRFDGWDKVVFNTKQSGQWGSEERKRSMPFTKGEHFEMVVMVLQEHYKVTVNGNPFYEYAHRVPPQMVTHLQVDGDLLLQSINFIGGNPDPSQMIMVCPSYPGPGGTPAYPGPGGMPAYPGPGDTPAYPGPGGMPAYPGPGVAPQPPFNLPAMEAPPVFNPPVPYTGRLQGGLIAGRTIIIKGFVPPSAKRFAINLKVGGTGELALHINPRLDENCVVRNSLQKGAWESEERNLSYNPFAPGQYFDLSIRANPERFKVFANGQHLFDFVHRIRDFHMVDILEISGDVTLSYIQI